MNTDRHRSGFTLLEVMLALMVFSMAVVALVTAINGIGNASTESRQYREVQSRLESLLTEITRMPPDPSAAPGDRTLEKTVRENGVEYRIKKAPLELTNKDGQQLPDMFTVTATARWKEGGGDAELSAETMVYPPLYAPAR
jgi:prepilin-type N-terminal cleavage/methylation domain-containing protein